MAFDLGDGAGQSTFMSQDGRLRRKSHNLRGART